MSAPTMNGKADAPVDSLRAQDAGTQEALAETPAPSYADITAGPAPATERTAIFPVAPSPIPEEPGKRRPIIPEPLRPENIRGTARQAAGLNAHRAGYHGLRLLPYLFMTIWYSMHGFRKVLASLLVWWHWTHGWLMESQAVAAGRAGHPDAMRAHTEGKKTRTARGKILAACVIVLVTAVGIATYYLPAWVWAAVIGVSVALLARHGKPKGKAIISAAVVPPKYEPPTPVIITRALGSLGIKAIDDLIKAGAGLVFVTDVHRDGEGWGCDLDLPHGVTAKMILQRREQFASGLRRPLSATWPEGVPEVHEGRLRVWIGFTDISKVKLKPWPLLKAGTADVFAGVPFGTDPRGRRTDAGLFEVNWLIGAAPGQGKTAAVRVLACGVALDPLAEMWVHEHSGKGDLEPFSKIAHRYVSGLDDEGIAYAAKSLQMLRTELDRRSGQMKKIPRHERPDGSVTRAMAEERHRHLYPIVAIFDEAQNLFMHPVFGKQAADDAAYVIRLGRAYGIIVILATQRPDKESLPTAISGIVTARFCMKVPDQPACDMILGTGSYKAGYNPTLFRAKTDAGLGWLKAQGDPQVTRTYYLDLDATERVVQRARALRGEAGTLTGYCLGEDENEIPRDFLADVLAVFGTDRNLWCSTIAERLAERLPGSYKDITSVAVASQLRGREVEVKNVREAGKNPNQGCERAAVETAAGVMPGV